MKIVLLFFIFFLGKIFAFSQSNVPGFNLALIDSISLSTNDFSDKYNFPIIRSDANKIYYTGGDSLKINVYDFNGKLLKHLPKNLALNLSNPHNALLPVADGSVYFGFGGRSLVHFSEDGSVLDTLRFVGKFNNKTYYINQLVGVTDYAIKKKGDVFFLPVLHFAKDLGFIKNPKYYRESGKLLAVCKINKGELIIQDIIGKRDPIFYEKLFPHLNYFQFQLEEAAESQSKLYITEQASPAIRAYKTSGELLQTFGEPARNPGINTTAIPREFMLNLDKGGYYGMKNYIESPIYTFIYHANNLTFRGYRSAVADPTKYKKYKDSVVGCNIVGQSPIDIAQHTAIKAKPYGLQIYDAENKLVFDAIMPRPFRSVLYREGNIIWADGRPDPKNKVYWIYRYQINSDEALGSVEP